MLRILVPTDEANGAIHLDGKLLQAWIPAVRAAVAGAQARVGANTGAGGTSRIDLQGLTYIDQDGLGLLHELAANGVVLVGASPFISELLANFGRHPR